MWFKKNPKVYQIVAICSKCGKEVTRSKKFNSRKELSAAWDFATLVAPQALPVCSCGKQVKSKGMNFDMLMKVAVIQGDSEEILNPKAVLKKSKHSVKI